MNRAFFFFERVRLRRIYYAPWVGCFVVLCFAPMGRELGGAALVGPSCGLVMLALAMPPLGPDPAYPFLRSATRFQVLTVSWMTAGAYGVAMLLPAVLLAALLTAAAWSRTELLLAGTTFALGLSVRVPVSFGHGKRLIPFIPALALSFTPGTVAALRGPSADPHAYAMAGIALDLLFIPICGFLTARAWRRADL
jgi:hypothetical protein